MTLGLALALVACQGTQTEPVDATVLDREAFIATYVDLRTSVIRGEAHELSDPERARILSDHGVTEDELTGFVEAHGSDVEFMRAVWDEVEARLDAVRLVPGSEERR